MPMPKPAPNLATATAPERMRGFNKGLKSSGSVILTN
jgi:hypothetical protein